MGLKSGGVINRHQGAGNAAYWYFKSLGLQGWWAAYSVSGTDGATVSTWSDLSGVGNHLGSSPSQKPVLKLGANGINNLPALSFNGSDQSIGNSTMTWPAVKTIVMVSKCTKALGNRATIYDYYAGKPQYNTWSYGATAILTLQETAQFNGAWARGNPDVVTAVCNGASSAIYGNGNSVASGNCGSDSNTGMTIGREQGSLAAVFYEGLIAEILYFNTALATAGRQYVERWLGARYNITVA